MKILRLGGIALLLMVGLLPLTGSAVIAQEADPGSVYLAAYDAFNAGDIDGGMALVAEDVVGVVLPTLEGEEPAQIGKEAFRGIMEDMVSINAHWTFDDVQVNDNSVTYRVRLDAEGPMAEYGLFPLELYGLSVVRDGLIEAEVWSMDNSSRVKLDAIGETMVNEALVARYMRFWDTVNGDLDDFDEIVSEGFISHGNPEADREDMRAYLAGFHADNPGAYFAVDELVIADGKAYITLRMWMVPEGAAAGDEGEPVSTPYLVVLGIDDGQISDRWLFATPE